MKNNLSGSIVELERTSPIKKFMGIIFVVSLNKLLTITEKGLNAIYAFCGPKVFHFLLGGLWVYSKNNEANVDVEKFVDLFDNGKKFKDIEIRFGSDMLEISAKQILGFNFKTKPLYLYIYDVTDGSTVIATGKFRYFSYDGEHIYAKNVSQSCVCCFNLKLEKIWELKLEGINYGDWTQVPQLFEDLVLVNHAFKIIAFHKKSGKEIWRHYFDESCGSSCCNLIVDRIYAESNGYGYVINPGNGEVLLEIPFGFLSTKQKQCGGIYFYPFQGKFVVLSAHDNAVRVFSTDGTELLQELHCPREYKISSNIPPVITDDAIYQSVYSRTAVAGGVLVLSVSDNGSDSNIKIQSRPEIYITKQEEQGGKHAYNLYVDAMDADTINRFGQISIKEIHFETGSEVYSDYLEYDGRDKQHNGTINFFVDPSLLSEPEKKRLKSDFRELEARFKELDCTAGDGTSAIKIEVLFRPKPEWDLSGEPVDLKQLRETRWANDPDEVGYS